MAQTTSISSSRSTGAVQRRNGDDDLLDELQLNLIRTVAVTREVFRSRSSAVNKMIFAIPLLVVLCLFTLWWISSPGTQYVTSVGDYEYLLMSQQWPTTVCMSGGCARKKIRKVFGIHGLWPTNTTKPYPQFCSNDPKDAYQQMPKGLEAQLHMQWPTLFKGKDAVFWEKEWIKHGTCSLDKFSQTDYFSLALSIKKNVDLLKLLKQDSIVPSNTNTYSLGNIVNAVKVGTNNFEPGILCSKSRSKISPLQEIRVCLEADGVLYKNCPQSIRAINCKSMISLPI